MQTTVLCEAPEEGDATLGDYLVFRLDDKDDRFHRELCGESALELEAGRFADMLADTDHHEGIRYEVRLTATGELLYSVQATPDAPRFCESLEL